MSVIKQGDYHPQVSETDQVEQLDYKVKMTGNGDGIK